MLSIQEEGVQARVLGAFPKLHAKPSAVLTALHNMLFTAFNEDRMRTGTNDIYKWVQLYPNGQPIGPRKAMKGSHSIVGGVKDFKRRPSSARIVRDDGAFIHFTITFDCNGSQELQMLAYDFEIVFPEGHSPPFLRIDLNSEWHDNKDRELRSHIHPGNDDLLFPAPVMTPEEILHLFIHGLRPRDKDKPRA
jgi:hypothetical protein